MTKAFTLDPRLAADTVLVGDLMLSRVLLMNDARFPWLILVPRRAQLREIVDLAASEQNALMGEIAAVSLALQRLTSPHKLNVAALGNQVAQLHVHVIARFSEDAAWPRPVWGIGTAEPYPAVLLAAEAARYRAALGRLEEIRP